MSWKRLLGLRRKPVIGLQKVLRKNKPAKGNAFKAPIGIFSRRYSIAPLMYRKNKENEMIDNGISYKISVIL